MAFRAFGSPPVRHHRHPFQNSPASLAVFCAFEGNWAPLGNVTLPTYLDVNSTVTWRWKTLTANFKPCSATRWRVAFIKPAAEMLGYVSLYNLKLLWRLTSAPTPSPTRSCSCGRYVAIFDTSPADGACIKCPEVRGPGMGQVEILVHAPRLTTPTPCCLRARSNPSGIFPTTCGPRER